MSAEHFFEPHYHYSMPEIAAQAVEKSDSTMPIVFLAELLQNTTRDSMITVSMKHESGIYPPDRETGYEVREEALTDYVSSIYGSLVTELDYTRTTGQFDLESFIEKSNSNLVGTLIPNLPDRNDSTDRYYVLTEDEKREFNERYKKDPTYADFFMSPRTSLPQNLLEYLDSERHLREVVTRTLPTVAEYWKRTADEFLKTCQEVKEGGAANPEKAMTPKDIRRELESMTTEKKADLDRMIALQRQGFTLEQIRAFVKLSDIRDYNE